MEKQRVNMDIDKELWKKVGIRAIELNLQKREVVELALEKFLQEGDFKKMKTNYGKTMINGKIYKLTEEAFPTNCILGAPYKDYNDAECGEEYNFEMGAKAVDPDGKECMVYWIFQDIKCDEQKDLDDYDYSEADNIKYL